MGAIKKMIEEEIPGIYVLSLEIGKNIFEVKDVFCFLLHTLESECNNYCVCHSFKALQSQINMI